MDLYIGIISFSSIIFYFIVQQFVTFDYLCTSSRYFYYADQSNGKSFLEWLQLTWESEMYITSARYSFYYAFLNTEFHLQSCCPSTKLSYFIVLSA